MATAHGSRQKFYFVQQSSFTGAKIPASAGAVKLKDALVFSKTQEAQALDEFKATTRSSSDEVIGPVTCTMAGGSYIKGSGTQGTAPDLTDIYQSDFDETTTAATTVAASPTPTTSAFKLTADNLDAGQFAWIETAAGEKRHFYVLSKDAGTKVLTVFPPFTAAPTALDVVSATVNYNLNLDNAVYLSCHRSSNLEGEMGVGGKFHNFTWKFTRGEPGEVSFDGQCRNAYCTVKTTLNGAINDSVTTVVVDNVGIEAGAVIAIDTECMLVTAVDATGLSLTVTRGYDSTSAASHSDEAVVGPYEPTETTAGSAIRGLEGGLYIANTAGTGTLIKATDVSFNCNDKPLYFGWHGDSGMAGDVAYPEDREAGITFSAWLNAEAIELVSQAVANDKMHCFLQAGNTAGRACAFYIYASFDKPQIQATKGELTQVQFTSRNAFQTSGENALSFAF